MFNLSFKTVSHGVAILCLSSALFGCGGGAEKIAVKSTTPLAQDSDITVAGMQAGVTPFISSVQLGGQYVADVISITYTIAPMTNSVSKPVSVTWGRSALQAKGYYTAGVLNLPVFGLYANYQNQVSMVLTFSDDSTQTLQAQISTQPYADPSSPIFNPTIVQARAPGSALDYNFFVMKDFLSSPVVIDSDGQVRWIVPVGTGTASTYYSPAEGEFVSGSGTDTTVSLIQWDGTTTTLPTTLTSPYFTDFTHNLDPSPNGFLAEFDGNDDLGVSKDDIVADMSLTPGAPLLQVFSMADVLSTYMNSQGDNAAAFVRPGADWFHLNAATYDPTDQTVIVSSRENFLIKVNYASHDIVWILGDPTKYWYTFPSLRAKALTLTAGGDYPIGQHGVSITSEGYIMVMNDGYGSTNQSAGEPAGLTRSFSEVSAYSINAASKTAQNVWNFNYGQSIYSPICGSSYQTGSSYLVTFSTATDFTQARLVGLDKNKNVVFDFQYDSPSYCGTAWNAIPIAMENLQIN